MLWLGNESNRHHEQDRRDFRTSQSESKHGPRQSERSDALSDRENFDVVPAQLRVQPHVTLLCPDQHVVRLVDQMYAAWNLAGALSINAAGLRPGPLNFS
jgi:hypothetical protein